MYHRATTETGLMSFDDIFHIQPILCFIATATRSSSVKMSSPRQNVVISQKNQEIV